MNAEVWKKIHDLNLKQVREKFLSRKSWWWKIWNDAAKLEMEYKQFLYLIAVNPGQEMVPWSQDMDDFWHEHILDTIKYQKDCMLVLGRPLHHNPHVPKGTSRHSTASLDTRKKYKEAFGKEERAGYADAGCSSAMPIVFCASSGCSSGGSDHGDAGGGSDASCGSSCGSSCGGGCSGCGGD